MRIPPLETFPEIEQRSKWAKFLELDGSTLFRATQRGELTPVKTKTGRVLYSKATILEWLNLRAEPLPTIPK